MNPLIHTPDAPPDTALAGAPDPVGRFLRRTGGVALIACPVLLFAGMMTCPPQTSDSTADYITALARDSFLTELSAILLHYGLILGALGVLAVPGLVGGPKGRWLTVAGALAATLGMLNVSGAVRDDWWRMVLGQRFEMDVAVRVSDLVDTAPFMPAWSGTEILAFLGLLILCVGLARARVAGWWLTAAFVMAFVGMSLIPIHLTYVAGTLFALLFLPLGVAGAHLLRRAAA
ncbi:hypothetical protein [Spongiactinospora sp. TRM90649]|uniref:hypothetical protein n=1 Tax=Spongiactinospora sp. TRM90649 TaxID=3031114 RepID=UPI0023F81E3C|nr:hypothetical protein [Spongiactinospora sp. TRM90649]MDF5757313.1 hypothetical protein [Spongiactinospora sp. TRM90649]